MRKKKIEIPLLLVELENENYHIMVESLLPNHVKGMWIVDTGASKTVLDSNLSDCFIPVDTPLTDIESMGIGAEMVETKSGIIESIYFGSVRLADFQVALIDLSSINKLYLKYTNNTITGLIGSDFLVRYKAIINFKKMIIQFYI